MLKQFFFSTSKENLHFFKHRLIFLRLVPHNLYNIQQMEKKKQTETNAKFQNSKAK